MKVMYTSTQTHTHTHHTNAVHSARIYRVYMHYYLGCYHRHRCLVSNVKNEQWLFRPEHTSSSPLSLF